MKRNIIAVFLALALLLASLTASAEGFGKAPTVNIKLGVGESYAIDTAAILTVGAVLQYKTSNPRVVSVSAEGVITALRRGKATVAIGYDNTLLGLCKVNVVKAPGRVAISDANAVLSVGDTKQLSAKLPRGTASALVYESSNPAVATVDETGLVTALTGGRTTVSVKTFNDKVAECAVYVLGGKAPTTLSLNAASIDIQVGETFQLAASVDEGSDAFYKYASQNRKIARVDGHGLITGVRKGATSVAVRTHNGLIQAVTVNVKPRLRDVYGCLTDVPATFLEYARKLKLERDEDGGEDGVVYSNGELTMIMTAHSCQVALAKASSARYCVLGVDTAMTPEAAAAKLIAKGWALTGVRTSDGVEQRAFTLGGDASRYVAIATVDGTTIQGLTAQWSW